MKTRGNKIIPERFFWSIKYAFTIAPLMAVLHPNFEFHGGSIGENAEYSFAGISDSSKLDSAVNDVATAQYSLARTTLRCMKVTRELEAHHIVDKNGVRKTVWKKPASAPRRSVAFPAVAAVSPVVSAREEQQVIFEELFEALTAHDTFRSQSRLGLIETQHQNKKKDSRPLFKTFLVSVQSVHPLHFVEAVHDILLEYGTDEPHLIINNENLDAIHRIVRATGNTYVPSKRKTTEVHVREFINHALTCGVEAEVVLQIITERRPKTTAQLEEMTSEFQRSPIPLQHGAL